MAATLIDQKISMLDSAIGPIQVTSEVYNNFDVDDFVSFTVKGKAEYLIAINKLQYVNPIYTAGRPPVRLNGTSVGGFDV